jgi:hypothetical protein
MIAALAQGLGVQACDLVEGIPAPDATQPS